MDLTVMGAGIFGLSTAWYAATLGARVRVIDPHGIGAGASGGLVGALAPHAPEGWTEAKALQLEALLAAPAWWAAVEAAGGLPSGYGQTGRVQPVLNDTGLMLAAERGRNAETLWQGRAHWRLRAQGQPHDPISPTGMVVEDSLTARIHPRMALQALAAALRAKGGEIVTEGEAHGPTIWATGAQGLMDLSARTGHDIGRGEKGQALLMALDLRTAPQIYAPGLHIIPHADGRTAIGSTSERFYDDAHSTDDKLTDLLALAVATLPALAQVQVLERWAGVRPRARSRKLVLGADPSRAGHFIANGGFKTGFAMAPLAARLIVDLALQGQDAIPESLRIEGLL